MTFVFQFSLFHTLDLEINERTSNSSVYLESEIKWKEQTVLGCEIPPGQRLVAVCPNRHTTLFLLPSPEAET